MFKEAKANYWLISQSVLNQSKPNWAGFKAFENLHTPQEENLSRWWLGSIFSESINEIEYSDIHDFFFLFEISKTIRTHKKQLKTETIKQKLSFLRFCRMYKQTWIITVPWSQHPKRIAILLISVLSTCLCHKFFLVHRPYPQKSIQIQGKKE